MSAKWAEVVVRSQRDAFPLPLQSCHSWMFVKDNPERRKKSSFGAKLTLGCQKNGSITNSCYICTSIWYSHQRINQISSKVKCTLLHKQRKMISFARTPSTIKCLEIFKIKVQTFRNWSKFWQESWKGRVNVCQRCSRMPTKLSTRNDYGKSRKSSRKCFFWRAYTSAIAEKQQWRRYWRKN